jgi:hypothetical protein
MHVQGWLVNASSPVHCKIEVHAAIFMRTCAHPPIMLLVAAISMRINNLFSGVIICSCFSQDICIYMCVWITSHV